MAVMRVLPNFPRRVDVGSYIDVYNRETPANHWYTSGGNHDIMESVGIVSGLLFGVATGFLPSALFMFLVRELRTQGLTKKATVAITLTIGLFGGESWVGAKFIEFLFVNGQGEWFIIGSSGIFIISAVASLVRYLVFSLSK